MVRRSEGELLAYLEPASGNFKRYEIEDDALPHNLIVDGKGMVWYAGNGNGHIGRLKSLKIKCSVANWRTRR